MIVYRTKSGVLVRQGGRPFVDERGVTKIHGYRLTTGSFHGSLRLDRLTPINMRASNVEAMRRTVRR